MPAGGVSRRALPGESWCSLVIIDGGLFVSVANCNIPFTAICRHFLFQPHWAKRGRCLDLWYIPWIALLSMVASHCKWRFLAYRAIARELWLRFAFELRFFLWWHCNIYSGDVCMYSTKVLLAAPSDSEGGVFIAMFAFCIPLVIGILSMVSLPNRELATMYYLLH